MVNLKKKISGKNKQLMLTIIGLIGLVAITVGVSVAFFNYTKTGASDNTLTTGGLSFLYTEVSGIGRGIMLEDAVPMSDELGKVQTGEGKVFEFKITSKSSYSSAIPYEVTARMSSDSTLDQSKVRIYLEKDNYEVLLDNFNSLQQTTRVNVNDHVEKVLYKGKVPSNTDNYNETFKLKMWLSSAAVSANNEYPYNDKIFKITVNVYADGKVLTAEEKELETSSTVQGITLNDTELTPVTGEAYDYYQEFPQGTTSATIDIDTEDPDANIRIERLDSLAMVIPEETGIVRLSTRKVLRLNPGDNYFRITVTSEDGNSQDISVLKIKVESIVTGDSILKILQDNELGSGYHQFIVGSETYDVHMITLPGGTTINSSVKYGNADDVASGTNSSQMAKKMVVVKVNGDLTVGTNGKIEPYYDQYGGPKGFMLYVTGKLTNNGIIDNSHGAYALGQDVFLWKNANGTYEKVPAVGANSDNTPQESSSYYVGIAGKSGTVRQTGQGGSGTSHTSRGGQPSRGGYGTSYSGGMPSGHENSSTPGDYGYDRTIASATSGGLMIIYANEYENNGSVTAVGAQGNISNDKAYPDGSAGGGSINIFTNQSTKIDKTGVSTNDKYDNMLGNVSASGGATRIGYQGWLNGGAGGNGTVNIGEIRNGIYYDLRDIIEQDKEVYQESITKRGDSIISILQNNENLTEGYYRFIANGETYLVHLIEEDNHVITSNATYGTLEDCARGTSSDLMAQNMVIVKVNGDYTINQNVTVGPYYGQYGGPKGFMLYVTGTLTNNGTIDNSHGAYAIGQDVYLWKNTNGTYEKVPALGANSDNTPQESSSYYVGIAGKSGTGRQTGQGGSGASHTSRGGQPSRGGYGTSYSGGMPSGHENSSTPGDYGYDRTIVSATPGGLIVIYANEYINNGDVKALGMQGGISNDVSYPDGSAGGGSINIFYQSGTTNNKENAAGGETKKGYGNWLNGGAGGNGTVNIGSISTGTYVAN